MTDNTKTSNSADGAEAQTGQQQQQQQPVSPQQQNQPQVAAPAQGPAATAPKAQARGESLGKKIAGGFSWWIGSLTGKPVSRRAPQQIPTLVGSQAPMPPELAQSLPKEKVSSSAPEAPVDTTKTTKTEPQVATTAPATDQVTADPVAQDIESLKKLVGKFSGKVTKTVTPKLQKGVSTTSTAATSFVKTVDPGFIKKILRIFLIILFLMVAGFVALKLFQTYGENGGNGVPTGNGVKTSPTPIVYEPFKPSLYAQDPEILKLEEDVDVLVREISGSNIKEITLNPPSLDFNITF